jgi:hypothetical protein
VNVRGLWYVKHEPAWKNKRYPLQAHQTQRDDIYIGHVQGTKADGKTGSVDKIDLAAVRAEGGKPRTADKVRSRIEGLCGVWRPSTGTKLASRIDVSRWSRMPDSESKISPTNR